MKKIITLLLVAALALSLIACGAPEKEEDPNAIKAEDIVGTWVLGNNKHIFNADGTGTVTIMNGIQMSCDWTFKDGTFTIGWPTGEATATMTRNEDGSLILHYNGGDYTLEK